MSLKILVPWAIPQAGKDALVKAKAEVTFLHGPNGELPKGQELIEAVKQADVFIPRATLNVSKEALIVNPNLKGVANYGVGYDNIDVSLATKLGIPVTNTPDVLTETTADLAWALLMATARKIPQAHQYTLSGEWTGPGSRSFMGLDIGPGGSNRSKVLGIIGFGKIGQAVMRRSRGFRMKVLVFDPPLRPMIENRKGVQYREIDDLLKESDFITLHCPLREQTHHLIGEREFKLMKPTAILINTSRGPIVDEKALVAVIQAKRIAGAGLDVYENEPNLTPGLEKLENVVLLPHIGSASDDTRSQMAVVAVKNALAMARGRRPPDIVDPRVFDASEYMRRVDGKKLK